MTKKHFIALADVIKTSSIPFTLGQVTLLAEFCQSQNPRFDSDKWLGYIASVNGPYGGKVTEMNDRRHFYLYTVIVTPFPLEGLIPEVQVEAYNKVQVARKLGKKLDEVIYIMKVIVQ